MNLIYLFRLSDRRCLICTMCQRVLIASPFLCLFRFVRLALQPRRHPLAAAASHSNQRINMVQAWIYNEEDKGQTQPTRSHGRMLPLLATASQTAHGSPSFRSSVLVAAPLCCAVVCSRSA